MLRYLWLTMLIPTVAMAQQTLSPVERAIVEMGASNARQVAECLTQRNQALDQIASL